MTIEKYTLSQVKSLKSDRTNWERVERLSDSDITLAANTDKDAPLVSSHNEKRFRRGSKPRHKLFR
ncbi:hypothetical protein NBRC116591_21150 [Sessilibacter corallicola]|uniref:Uncharacterized protein n=1 Tax=Sessilibacter corallicola TaxID=2904075 RepID=A0ABQ0A9H4_9GAMM